MRSRRRRTRAIAWLLAAGAALTPPATRAQGLEMLPESRFVKQSERFTPDGGAPIELHFAIAREAAGQTSRFVDTTHAALTLMSAWFGPPPSPRLHVAGVFLPPGHLLSWAPGAATVSVPVHWLTPARDQRTERKLISGIAREYWFDNSAPSTFEYALIEYTAARATHELLEGSNFATPVFLGGFVPFPLRSVLLSPPVADPRPRAWRFDDPKNASSAEVRRAMRALQTIERYVGWPTMLEALARLRAEDRRDPEAFAAALSDVRGTDLGPLVAECLRADAVFDYSLDALQSQPAAAGLIETTVTITRRGSGRFAIGDGEGDAEAAMPLRIRFADGSEARDYFDGAAPASTLIYSAKTAAVAATVDPDAMLLLDVDRANNAIVLDARPSTLGIRLALNWMAWLQNAMLSYTALL